MSGFSFARVLAMLVKEFREMMRGKPSVILSIPVIQLLLFGYAINDNPHHLATGVFVQDQGEFSRDILAAMRNSGYFDIVATAHSSAELDRLMALGKIEFSVTIPAISPVVLCGMTTRRSCWRRMHRIRRRPAMRSPRSRRCRPTR